MRSSKGIRLLLMSSFPWFMKNCAFWLIKDWPMKSQGKLCRQQLSFTRPICDCWVKMVNQIGIIVGISLQQQPRR